MKNLLLASTAAAALLAFAGQGVAQTQPGGATPPSAGQSPSGGGSAAPSTPSRTEPAGPGGGERSAPPGPVGGRDAAPAGADKPRAGQSENEQRRSGGERGQQPAKPDSKTEGGRDGSSAAAPAKIDTQQRSKLKEHRTEFRAGRVDNVNFSISIGASVPQSVTLHPLPPTIVEIVPAWRSYRFVMVKEQIIIIDPETHAIVAIVEV